MSAGTSGLDEPTITIVPEAGDEGLRHEGMSAIPLPVGLPSRNRLVLPSGYASSEELGRQLRIAMMDA